MIPIIDLGKKRSFQYSMLKFDSKEEIWFTWYLQELQEAGFIDSFEYQPEPFSLFPPVIYNYQKSMKTKKKTMTTSLLRAHSYQADFKIVWSGKALGLFFAHTGNPVHFPFTIYESLNLKLKSWIDVKPTFDHQNMTRLFHINQKWVFQKHGVYVQKIVPQELFAKTFTPERYLFTDKSLKPRKINFEIKSLTTMKGASQ